MKFIYTLILLLLFPMFAAASVLPDKIYATTPVELNNKLKDGEIVDLDILKLGNLSQNMELEHGEAITVKILSYVPPKRGKRDGYYKVNFEYNKTLMKGKMAVAKQADIKEISKKAGAMIAGHALGFVMLPQAYAVTKGIIKPNEDQTRLRSVSTNLYNSTPLPYTKRGDEFYIPAGGVIILKLKNDDSISEDTDEYED